MIKLTEDKRENIARVIAHADMPGVPVGLNRYREIADRVLEALDKMEKMERDR